MRTTALTKILLRFIVYLLMPLVLANCVAKSPPSHVRVRHVSAAKQQFQPYEFVGHTTLAYLRVTGPQPANNALSLDLDILDGFSAEMQKASLQPVIILTYSLKNKKPLQHVVVPFDTSSAADEKSLLGIMNELEIRHYILQDVNAGAVNVVSQRPLKLKERDLKTTKVILEQQIQGWVQKFQVYDPVAEAQVQIKLIHFFMEHQMKEAAYLSVDNAKQALASSEEYGAVNATGKDLSQQLSQLENQLRTAMPYSAF